MGIIVAVVSLLFMLIIALFYAYRRVFWVDKSRISPLDVGIFKNFEDRREEMREMVREALTIPYEDVYVQSFDGLKLHAKYYETQAGAPIQIMCHGYRGHANKDFSGGLKMALDSGFNVILIDQRAHGESEGQCLSFGVLERRDLKNWVDYAVERFGPDCRIILVGISMGAATVVMASEYDMPQNVKGIIADCPYSSPKKIIIKVMKDLKYPSAIMYPVTKLAAKIFGHFDIEECSAEEAGKKAKLPLLLIHGQEDDFVPHYMSVEIYDNYAGEKYFESFPVASHGMSFMADYERYKNCVSAFTERILS